MNSEQQLNLFFVDCFNAINRNEEKAMDRFTLGLLSVKEIHIIETISKLEKTGQNTIGETARTLNITLGTLSVAVNVLVRKGYIEKVRDKKDKRIIYLSLTPLGQEVNDFHSRYHENMIKAVIGMTTPEEQQALVTALAKLKDYFQREATTNDNDNN